MAREGMIQVRVENELKAQAEELFEDLGLDTASAIRLFLKQAVMYQGIPFAIVRQRPLGDSGESTRDQKDHTSDRVTDYTQIDSGGEDMINDMDLDF